MIDPVFHLPFLTGLLAALLLAWCGLLERLREEGLAALSYAQAGGLGLVAAPLLGLAALPGALLGALAAATVKPWLARSADGLILLLLGTWGLSLLLVANLPSGENLGRLLVDGQLYFTRLEHAVGLGLALLAALVLLPRLTRGLQRERLFPARRASLPSRLVFELLVAASLALAAASLGVMAAFALAFLPARAAFQIATRWSSALLIALGIGLGAHLLAFVLALQLDQPYGPVVTLLLLATALPAEWLARQRTPLPSAANPPS
ncbi:MAG: metal ABC transporter permease [Pseudomonadota bacterium]